jgi:hypothetical protein
MDSDDRRRAEKGKVEVFGMWVGGNWKCKLQMPSGNQRREKEK